MAVGGVLEAAQERIWRHPGALGGNSKPIKPSGQHLGRCWKAAEGSEMLVERILAFPGEPQETFQGPRESLMNTKPAPGMPIWEPGASPKHLS